MISYASEDWHAVAKPLAGRLRRRDFSVWVDQWELKTGDTLVESIPRGLSQSRFAVVILSKAYFAKNWPKAELLTLLTREINSGRLRILPIYHGVTWKDVDKKVRAAGNQGRREHERRPRSYHSANCRRARWQNEEIPETGRPS